MHTWLKISHHSHSGRLRPHEHTSYGPLFVLLLIVGLVLTISTVNAQSPGPQAGSIGLTGGMPGKPPDTAAVITSPRNGQRFTTSPVNVSGTCPSGTLVQIYKNDIFAGSTPCDGSGRFSVDVDLLIGQNILIARVYDALNQPGPDSAPVTVFYDALPPQPAGLNPLGFGGAQLLLVTDAVYRGIFPNQTMKVPVTVLGGTPPYAVNVQWGDLENKLVPRNDNLLFHVEHVYKKPGVFQLTLQATDSQGRVAFLTVAAIVNGQPDQAAGGTSTDEKSNTLFVLWPLFVAAVAVVIAFWLGERREKHILLGRGINYRTAG